MKKEFNKKLALKKSTVAHLGNTKMQKVKGGIITCHCNTQDGPACWSAEPDSKCAFCLSLSGAC